MGPRRYGNDFQSFIFEHMLRIKFMNTSCEMALKCMPQNNFDGKSIMDQAKVWCRQATRHYPKRFDSDTFCHMVSRQHELNKQYTNHSTMRINAKLNTELLHLTQWILNKSGRSDDCISVSLSRTQDHRNCFLQSNWWWGVSSGHGLGLKSDK